MRTRVLALVLLFSSVFANSQSPNVVLGVLEDLHGHFYEDPSFRAVRVIFQKNGNEWQAFQSNCPDTSCLKTVSSKYPREVTWTIAFDGRNLGKVTGRTQDQFRFYSDLGLQDISSGGTVPTMGKRSLQFGGYRDYPVFRPLIANSQPYFKDPDVWKPSSPDQALIEILLTQFRKKFPELCRASKTDTSKLEPFPYRVQDIVVAKAYGSKTGWNVARMHIEAINCNDLEAGFDIDDPWFVASPQHSVAYLDSGLWLVDAGDYDNDGRSELVFSIDRDNEGGYELFYDGFQKRAVFNFNYH